MKYKHSGFLALLGTSFIYGLFGVIARALEPYLTANQMTFARSGIVAIILFFVLLSKKISFKVERKLWLPLFIHSITFGVTIFLFTYAVLTTSLSKATFSFYTTTLITSLIVSLLIFKEGLSAKKGFSFALAVVALLLFIFPSGIESFDIGMMFTAIAGVSDVITNSMKKYLGDKVDRLTLVFYQMITGLLFGSLLIINTQQFHILKPLNIGAIAWLLFFALNFFLLSWLASYGFQHFDLNLGTIILSLEFVWASIAGFFLYGEKMNMYQIIASIALVICIILINLPDRKSHKPVV